jgi:hypothetical protein
MLQFSQSDTNVNIIVTLQELTSLNAPNYLFVFTHVTTKQVVAFVKLNNQDLSAYPNRYNEFNLNPLAIFSTPGEWHYRIYEQASNSNIDPALSGAVIERGKMMLDHPALNFSKYESGTNFKTYDG